MITQAQIIDQGHNLGFEDVGFTSAAPFDDHKRLLDKMAREYDWADGVGLDLKNGVDPGSILPGANTIIVLIEPYFNESYPASMEGYFGRCYLDDDRVTHDGLYQRIKAFRGFLRDHGIDSKVPFNLPHRVAAARALGRAGDTRALGPLKAATADESPHVRKAAQWALEKLRRSLAGKQGPF